MTQAAVFAAVCEHAKPHQCCACGVALCEDACSHRRQQRGPFACDTGCKLAFRDYCKRCLKEAE